MHSSIPTQGNADRAGYAKATLLRFGMPRLWIGCSALTLTAALIATPPVLAQTTTNGCETQAGSPAVVPELKHGLLQGYLAKEELPDSLKLLEGPPQQGSAANALDQAKAEATFPLQGSPRWTLAARDADLHFPAAATTFSCALGVPISESSTPKLVMLLRRSMTDAGLSTYRAKNHYQRPRPFMSNEKAICTPDDIEGLRKDGSYPSGHTAVGWAWALILSEIAPERGDQLLARGLAYGQSRNICNVHWFSDVQAGQLMGTATVARLQANPVFRADLQAARQEVQALRKQQAQPNGDCTLERQALER